MRVHIDHLPVSLVFEEQPRLVVRDGLEIGRRVVCRGLRFPVVVGQVCRLSCLAMMHVSKRRNVARKPHDTMSS